MLDDSSEKKSPTQRGSFFTTNPIQVPRTKPKKTIYSISSKEEMDIPIQRSHIIAKIGDSNENIRKQKGDDSELDMKRKQSISVNVDRTKLAGGYFTKLKKKHQEDYVKFRDEKSKSLDLIQLQSSIEKLQAKITELESKPSTEKKIHVVSAIVVKPQEKKSIDWTQKKVIEALGIAAGMILVLLLFFYISEGKNFFKNFFGNSLKIRSSQRVPKSIFKKLFTVWKCLTQ